MLTELCEREREREREREKELYNSAKNSKCLNSRLQQQAIGKFSIHCYLGSIGMCFLDDSLGYSERSSAINSIIAAPTTAEI